MPDLVGIIRVVIFNKVTCMYMHVCNLINGFHVRRYLSRSRRMQLAFNHWTYSQIRNRNGPFGM